MTTYETSYDNPATVQERQAAYGSACLSDDELLGVVLGDSDIGTKLAHSLQLSGTRLDALLPQKVEVLASTYALPQSRAARLSAALELARRVLQAQSTTNPSVEYPQQTFEYLQPQTLGLEVEKFWVLCLNRRNRLVRCTCLTSGTATSTLVHPREVFREAIHAGACAIVVAHNHPSGDPSPSSSDLQITRQLIEASKAIEISLLDHVVVGRPGCDRSGRGWYSFREAGLI